MAAQAQARRLGWMSAMTGGARRLLMEHIIQWGMRICQPGYWRGQGWRKLDLLGGVGGAPSPGQSEIGMGEGALREAAAGPEIHPRLC